MSLTCDLASFQLLRYGETYGDLDDEGNPTIVTETVMSHFKAGSFDMFQQEDLGVSSPNLLSLCSPRS